MKLLVFLLLLLLLGLLADADINYSTQLFTSENHYFSISSKDTDLASNKDNGLTWEILTSPSRSFSLFFWAFFGSGSQLSIVSNKSGVHKWSSPCVTIQRNHSTSVYSSGYYYGLAFNFTHGGELQVLVSGYVAWSSNTSGRGVTRAELLNSGNLVLLNATNATIWQSNDQPTSQVCPQPGVDTPNSKATRVESISLLFLILVLASYLSPA